jgi:hypothetical protein
MPPPSGVEEPVLLEGTQGWRHFLAWPGSWVFALLVVSSRFGLGGTVPVLVTGGALFLFFHLRYTGHFRLTSKRLVWRPRYGTPVEVPLDSIVPRGISALPAWGEVRVRGERTVTVRHAGLAGRLSTLLHLHHQALFRGAGEGRARVDEVAVLPARRAPEASVAGRRAEHGVAVLRPGYAAFLPAHRHAEVFRSLTGPDARHAEVDVTVELLVEHMRLLTETEFDVRMRQAVQASGGELWNADEVRQGPARVDGQVYRLGARGMGMELRPDAAQSAATDRIVRRWAA